MYIKLISEVATEPLTIEQARIQCQIMATDTAFDAVLAPLIPVVREIAEHETCRDLKNKTYELYMDHFRNVLTIPRNPLIEVVSISYKDENGLAKALTDFEFETGERANLYIKDLPSTNGDRDAVKITFRAGYETSAQVPFKSIQGMLILLSHFFDNRSEVIEGKFINKIPNGAEWLFGKDRVY